MTLKDADRRVVTLALFTMISVASPAWGGGYTVEQLFMLPLEELLEVTIGTVIPPRY